MNIRQLVSATTLLVALTATSAQATILTFDNCGGSGSAAIIGICSGGAVNQSYGDRVTGANTDAGGTGHDRFYGVGSEGFTPNIAVSYNNGFGWFSGFSLLTNVLYVGGDLGFLDITFTADPGYRAHVSGFDLGAFLPPEGGYQNVIVSIYEDINNPFFTQTLTVGESGASFNNITAIGSVGGSVTLRLDVRNLAWDTEAFIFDRESVGIDNIVFSQSAEIIQPPPGSGTNEGNGGEGLPDGDIPEPGTFVLVGGAALVGLYIRRRKA
jgi:hypothetical protein